MNFRSLLAAPLLVACTALPSFAAPIEWSLNNFTFEDGATASGSFVWDDDVITTFNINISDGSNDAFDARLFSDTIVGDRADLTSDPFDASDEYLRFWDDVFQGRQFRISLSDSADLDTANAMLALTSSPFTNINGFTDCFNCAPSNNGQAGAFLSGVEVSAVPLPGTALFLLAGLGGLAAAGRRKSK